MMRESDALREAMRMRSKIDAMGYREAPAEEKVRYFESVAARRSELAKAHGSFDGFLLRALAVMPVEYLDRNLEKIAERVTPVVAKPASELADVGTHRMDALEGWADALGALNEKTTLQRFDTFFDAVSKTPNPSEAEQLVIAGTLVTQLERLRGRGTEIGEIQSRVSGVKTQVEAVTPNVRFDNPATRRQDVWKEILGQRLEEAARPDYVGMPTKAEPPASPHRGASGVER